MRTLAKAAWESVHALVEWVFISRGMRTYRRGVADADNQAAAPRVELTPASPTPPRAPTAPGPDTRAARPNLGRRVSIADYSNGELDTLVTWMASDGRLRSRGEWLKEVTEELGFLRRGSRIEEAILAALKRTGTQG